MANFRSIKNSLIGGQISPTVWGRTDLPQYAHSCQLLQNMIPMTSGGAYRRPGSLFVDNLSTTLFTSPRVIPFVVSKTEVYAVVLSNAVSSGSIGACTPVIYRMLGNDAQDFVTATVSGTLAYTVATVATATAANAAGYTDGLGVDDEIQQIQYCQIADVLYLFHPNHKPQTIKKTDVDAFTVGDFDAGLGSINLTNVYPYLNENLLTTTLKPGATSGSGVALVASAALFVPTQVGTIYVINQGGVLGSCLVTGYTNSTHVIVTVLTAFTTSGTAYATWWESAWSPSRGYPKSGCIFEQRLVAAGTTHQPDSIWFSETANYNVFSLLGSTVPGGLVINGASGPTLSTTGVYSAPVDDSPGDALTTGPIGSQPFRITLSQNTLDTVQWLSPDKELLIGTISQEWIISPQNGDFSIENSPTVIQSKYGSSDISAVRIGYELIFCLPAGDEVRAYQYNYIDASFFAEPVQLLFDEYPKAESGANGWSGGRRKVRFMDWDVSRQTLWCLDTAGNLYGMTRDRKLSVTAWHTHQMGGTSSAYGVNPIGTSTSKTVDPSYYLTDGAVTSFAVIPNAGNGINDLWIIVKRTQRSGVGATEFWSLERIIGKNVVRDSAYSPISPTGVSTEPYLVDCCLGFPDPADGSKDVATILNDAVGLVAGIPILSGYALTGNYYSVTNGIFKIETAVLVEGTALITSSLPPDYGTAGNTIVFGLPYTPTVQPVRWEAGSVIGTAQAAIGKLTRVFIRVYKTMSMYVGMVGDQTESAAERVIFRDWSQPIGKSPELFTGYKRTYPPSSYDRESVLSITQPDPLPFTVTSVVMEGETEDG